ncbi:glycosyltransferase family 2 protein [Thiolapillus sp.]
MFDSAIILIPAHNEALSVAAVIREVSQRTNCHVVVIDDASTDHTATVARKAGATVLSLSVQLGAWGALQTGMRFALQRGYRFVITMDADGQHEAADLSRLFTPVYDGQTDVCIGACTRRGSRMRKIAWVFLKWVSGLSMDDITSGFRAYNRKALELLSGRDATLLEYQDIGVLAHLKRNNMSINEIQVNMCPRLTGHSRVYSSWLMVAYYMVQASILGFSKRSNR